MVPDQPPTFADNADPSKIKLPFRWELFDAAGAVTQPDADELRNQLFENQADAESWLGEYFPDLLDGGVESVSLLENGELVYGPMSLRA